MAANRPYITLREFRNHLYAEREKRKGRAPKPQRIAVLVDEYSGDGDQVVRLHLIPIAWDVEDIGRFLNGEECDCAQRKEATAG